MIDQLAVLATLRFDWADTPDHVWKDSPYHVDGLHADVLASIEGGIKDAAGSEDFLVHVAVRDNQDLYAFIIDRITQRPEVADVRTSVVYEHLHNSAIAPLR
ncbi:Lrp/AsnC ligand binding domain-containing protein [Kibdelosporangium lantanae]|uniref:Lrp/AsnC ligand binding domain-containing protein n=1 Tax=Kibdelosporangium lantanae TaxID=1497396 RepID=A0ABW3MIN9_9PSEU